TGGRKPSSKIPIIRASQRPVAIGKITAADFTCYTERQTSILVTTPATQSRNWRPNMANRKQIEEASVSEIPPEVVGAVVLADLAQIEADAATHPDPHARDRILRAANRLREIAMGNADVIEQGELAAA